MHLYLFIILSGLGFVAAQASSASSLNPFSGENAPVCEEIAQYPDSQRDPYQKLQYCRVDATGAKYIDFRDNQLTEPVTKTTRLSYSEGQMAMLPAISANMTIGAPSFPGITLQYTPCTYGAVIIYRYPQANDQGHIYEFELLNLRPPEHILREHEVQNIVPDDVYLSKASRELPGTAQLSPSVVASYCENLGGY